MESIYDINQIRELFKQGRFARCRSRFVVPVILYEGKVRWLQDVSFKAVKPGGDSKILCESAQFMMKLLFTLCLVHG